MKRANRQRGIVAIELACALGMSLTVLGAIVVLGRMTLHMVALEKAVSNTARIVGALPRETLTGPDGASDIPRRAKDMVLAATESAGMDLRPARDAVAGMCGPWSCGPGSQPPFVLVSANIAFRDTVFRNAFTSGLLPASGSQPIGSLHTASCAPDSALP